MIVALGALQVHAEEQPADVLGERVDFALAVQVKLGGRALLRVDAVGGQNLADELVVWLIGGEGAVQELAPFRPLDVLVGPAIHQQHVEEVGHVAGVTLAGQQFIDELDALVQRFVGEKCPRFPPWPG